MVVIQLTGHIDEHGRIELSEQIDLPPGDVVITIEPVSAESEAKAAAFDELLASPKSIAYLHELVAQALADEAAGLVDELDPETLLDDDDDNE